MDLLERKPRKAGVYIRVSTLDQHPENQIEELTRYCEARGLAIYRTYTDHGISGDKDGRPQLHALLKDAKARRFDCVVVWKIDRFSRKLRSLVLMLEDLTAAGVTFISVTEGIDLSSPGGVFQLHLLGALGQYERSVGSERVRLGMQRARREGKRIGRPRAQVTDDQLTALSSLSLRVAASKLGVSKSFISRWRASRIAP